MIKLPIENEQNEQDEQEMLFNFYRMKEEILKERFIHKGFSHLFKNVEKRRFKRIIVETNGELEEWYVDDGTDEGVLIVTFKKFKPIFKDGSLIVELKYW